MKRAPLTYFTFLILCSPLVCAQSWQAPLLQDHPMVGRIYDLNQQRVISEAELINQLRLTTLILIGEKHDNNDHHQLEARLIKALTRGLNKPAIVFEMLTDKQQPQLDTLSANESLSRMKTRLQWEQQSWPWPDYGPLFQLTRQNMAPLIGGNISRQTIRAIYKREPNALSDGRFSTLATIADNVRQQVHSEIYRNHCELMPRDTLKPMVNVQLARDASMASAMLDNRTDQGAVLIAGGFHVRKDLSVPLHLTARQPSMSQAVVLLAEVQPGKTSPADYSNKQQADYLWLTPKQNDIDYCAQMRAQMEQKAAKRS